MKANKQNTLGELTAQNFAAARIFEESGLDFCCGGKRTLEEACDAKGIDVDELISKLERIDEINSASTHFNQWEPDFLVDYIINNHHYYIKNTTVSIDHHLDRVIAAHSDRFPELLQLKKVYNTMKEDLSLHMMKEEKMLFPYIKKMSAAAKNSLPLSIPPFGSIKNPIEVMEEEHSEAGGDMEDIKKLTNNFTPPKNACGTFKVLYEELKDFEKDLHIHVHLENNILFPKAIELEDELLAESTNECTL